MNVLNKNLEINSNSDTSPIKFKSFENSKFEVMDCLSDLKLKVYGKDLKELFENAAVGMFYLICEFVNVGDNIKQKIRIKVNEEITKEDLLILWLEKLLFYHETKRLLFSKFCINKLIINNINKKGEAYSCLDALVLGEKIDLKKHEILNNIKAPTYHGLEIIKDNSSNEFFTQIVFDV